MNKFTHATVLSVGFVIAQPLGAWIGAFPEPNWSVAFGAVMAFFVFASTFKSSDNK